MFIKQNDPSQSQRAESIHVQYQYSKTSFNLGTNSESTQCQAGKVSHTPLGDST